jgi:glycosyltransferase involved in cell wall biosynthesis
LKIFLTVDPEIPVPPREYGGIERVIAFLVKEYTQKGLDVTLFANRDSTVPCKLVGWQGRTSQHLQDTLANTKQLWQETFRQKPDIIHSFSRLNYLLPLLPTRLPKLMSYQRHISHRSVQLGTFFARKSLHFSSCSLSLAKDFMPNSRWHCIYNGVDIEHYTFIPKVAADAPLVFLGRIEEIKGAHLAIEIAKLSGKNLILAGNIPNTDRGYFKQFIEPHINHRQIQYWGAVNDIQKNQLLGQCSALLMPILWEEPFGIVVIEALASGTPVVGFARGALPEIIEHSVTGFLGNTIPELVNLIPKVQSLPRAACRAKVEEQFSSKVIAQKYFDLYQEMMPR